MAADSGLATGQAAAHLAFFLAAGMVVRMKVLILGGGVIGVTSAYYLAKAGHEVTVIDRQPGPALETSFANAGEISPGYASPWAGPGIPLKAIKWLLMQRWAAGAAPQARSAHVDLGPAAARQLHRARLRRQQGPHGAARRIQPRLPDRAARRRPASPMTSATQGTLQLFRDAEAARRTPHERHRRAEAVRRALRGARPRRLRRRRAGPRHRRGAVRRRPAAAQRRDRRLQACSPSGWRRSPPRPASTFRFGTHDRRHRRPRATGSPASRPVAATLTADAYVVALGSYSPLLLAAARHHAAGLSDQGLLDHRADHRRGGGAGLDRDGRDLQGGDHPARRPHPRRRHGRDRRLRHDAAPASRRGPLDRSLRDLFPRGGDAGKATLLVRAAADDARRHAGDRPGASSATSTSTPATARSAGPWRPARAACSPTWCRAGRPRSTPPTSASRRYAGLSVGGAARAGGRRMRRLAVLGLGPEVRACHQHSCSAPAPRRSSAAASRAAAAVAPTAGEAAAAAASPAITSAPAPP